MGLFSGGNTVEGLSKNASERQQRLNQNISQFGFEGALDQQALANFFLTGEFTQGEHSVGGGRTAFGSLTEAPQGPAGTLVGEGLGSEVDLSRQRQMVAENMLSQAQQNLAPVNQFNLEALGLSSAALGGEAGFLQQSIGTLGENTALNQSLTNELNRFFSTGGAPSQAQSQQIGNIFNAQRQIGASNIQQNFGDLLTQLQDHATSRGLRFGDTPIQDRGGLLAEEAMRNLTNLETSLSGQQANALLNAPFQQAGLAGSLQGQQQAQNLNLFNAFSAPVNRGLSLGGQLTGQTQFASQFSPAAFSGPALQNVAGLISGQNFSTGMQGFSPTPIAQQPSFLRTMGQSAATSIGSSAGDALSSGISAFNPFAAPAGAGS